MAEEDVELEEQVGDGESSKSKGGGLKLLVIVNVIVLVLGGAGFFAYLAMSAEDGEKESGVEEEADGEAASNDTDTSDLFENGGVLALDTLLVNLASGGAGNDFIRVRIGGLYSRILRSRGLGICWLDGPRPRNPQLAVSCLPEHGRARCLDE